MSRIDNLFRFWPYAILFSCGASFGLSVFVVEHGTLRALFYTFFNAIALGTALATAMIAILNMRVAKRLAQITGLMPRSIQELGRNEERSTRTMGVTLINGDIRTIELPIDYTPMDDGGKLLMQTASPELFELLDMDELKITSEEIDDEQE